MGEHCYFFKKSIVPNNDVEKRKKKTTIYFSFCEAYYLSIKFLYCFAYLGNIDVVITMVKH